MKNFITLFIVIFIFNSNLFGQYSIMKTKVDYREYHYQTGDKYSPLVAGAASYFFPGLGDVYCGEVRRGLAFFGGSVGAFGMGMTGVFMVLAEGEESYGNSSLGYPLMVSGFLLMSTLEVWSIVDAVRVAKVKSFYYRNGDYGQFKIRVSPILLRADQNELKLGVGLNINF